MSAHRHAPQQSPGAAVVGLLKTAALAALLFAASSAVVFVLVVK